MKKICKSLLLTLLVVAMMLNTCGIVLADATATLEINEVEVGGGVYKLVFKQTTPAGADGVSATNVVFSYDESKIELMDSIDPTIPAESFDYAFNAMAIDARNNWTLSFQTKSNNGRTAFAVSASAPSGKAVNATSGVNIFELYYKVKNGESADSETFMLETNTAEGSFLATFYPTASNRITAIIDTIVVSGGQSTPSAQYKYTAGDNDTMTFGGWDYKDHDKLVLASLEIEPLTISGITVPAVYDAEGATDNEAFELNLTATPKSTINTTMDVPADAKWEVEYIDTEKVTISGTGANATLKVAPGAMSSTTPAVIKVAANGKTDSINVNITRAETLDPVYLEVKDGETVVPNEGVVTIAKPATEGTKTKTLTAAVYHPYDKMTAETTFAVVGTAPAGFGISEAGVISVTNNAEKGDVAIKATFGTLTKNITVRVVDLEVDETPIKVAETITYGMTNADIITFTSVDGTASVDGKTVTGKFTLADATGKPDAGETTIVVLFTPEGNTGDLAVYNDIPVSINKTVTVDKAVTEIDVDDVVATYNGEGVTVTATTNRDEETTINYELVGATVAYPPVNAGEYVVHVYVAESDNWAKAEKNVNVKINKAPVAIEAADATVTYDGTAKAITATVDNEVSRLEYSYERIGDAPEVVTYGASAGGGSAPSIRPSTPATPSGMPPVDAGVYKVTITAPATTNYAEATKEVTLTIEKARATEFVTEAPTPSATAKAFFEEEKTLADVKAALPATAEVKFGNDLVAEVEMTWADATEAFNAKGGTYTFVGTPSNDNLEFGDLKLTATFTLTEVTGTLTTGFNNITVAKADLDAADSYDDIKFPTSIEVTYGEDTSATVIDSLTWTKTLEELKAVAVDNKTTVGLAADTFPVWATITNAADFEFKVTLNYPVKVNITMASEGTYGTPLAPADAEQEADKDGIDEAGTFTYLYKGKTDNGEDYSSADVPTEAGTYTVTATLVSSTHAGDATATFKILPKEISVNIITEAAIEYSDANPRFGYELNEGSVLAEGDEIADLDITTKHNVTATTPAGAEDAKATAEAGNKNYEVEWTGGQIQIVAKPLSNTAFVPEITGDKANASTLTIKAIEGLDASQYDVFWNDATEAATEYTLSWADSNKTITAKIVGKGNYTGEKPVDEAKVYDIPKYEISGVLKATTVNGAESDAEKLDAGDTITLDLSEVVGAIIFSELGETPVYTWYLDGVAIENEIANSYEIKEADRGKTLTASVSLAEDSDFAGKVEVVVGEIGKSPISGTVTITAEGDVLTATVTGSNATADDYDVEWYRGETKLTPAEDGTYTVTVDDLGKVITVKVVAKEDSLFTGALQSTGYDVPAKAPTVTIATSVGATSITVTVNAVENGAPVTGYTITLKNGETVVGTAATSSHTFDGLTAGTTYTIEATATNSAGTTTATATASPYVASSSGLRPAYKPDPKPVTPDTGDSEGTEGEGEGTTTPEADVEVKVEDTSAKVDADVIKDNETVAVSTETESGTAVKTTVNVADANVASLEVSTKDSDKAAAGAAAEGAVGTPVEVKVDAKDAEGNKADVTVNVAIPSEEKAYAYIIDENGVATRTESVYNEETGEVEVANVPDGAVVMLSTTAPATFDDSAEHWAEDTINYAVDAGIMNGVGGSTFDPDGKATRGMVNAMMVRLAKVAGVEFAEAADQKVDTDTAHWAAATDLIALANGWSTGVRTLEDGTVVMDTDATVTREQLVTMLWRFVGNPEAEGEITAFDDHADTAEWAKDAKAWAVGAGIINGKPGNKLDPNGTATRAEIATMFNRLMKFMTK